LQKISDVHDGSLLLWILFLDDRCFSNVYHLLPLSRFVLAVAWRNRTGHFPLISGPVLYEV